MGKGSSGPPVLTQDHESSGYVVRITGGLGQGKSGPSHRKERNKSSGNNVSRRPSNDSGNYQTREPSSTRKTDVDQSVEPTSYHSGSVLH